MTLPENPVMITIRQVEVTVAKIIQENKMSKFRPLIDTVKAREILQGKQKKHIEH